MFSRPKTCIYHIKAVSCEPYKFCGEYDIYTPQISSYFWELNILRYKNILSLEAADNQDYLAKSERT